MKGSTTVAGYSYGDGVIAADFTGDGKPGLAVGNYGSNKGVSILLGNGDGTFTPGTALSTGNTYNYVQFVETADFNGDGIPDLAFLANNGGMSYALEIFLGNGNGTFTLKSTISGASNSFILTPAIGDFNNDGIPDIVAQTSAERSCALECTVLSRQW